MNNPTKGSTSVQNKRRRNFLAFAGAGAFSFVLGKILGPKRDLFSNGHAITETVFKNFKLVDAGEELKFYNNKGQEVLIIGKN